MEERIKKAMDNNTFTKPFFKKNIDKSEKETQKVHVMHVTNCKRLNVRATPEIDTVANGDNIVGVLDNGAPVTVDDTFFNSEWAKIIFTPLDLNMQVNDGHAYVMKEFLK